MKKFETKKIWVVWGIVISFLTGCNLASSGITPAIVSPASETPTPIAPSSTPGPTTDPLQLTMQAGQTQNAEIQDVATATAFTLPPALEIGPFFAQPVASLQESAFTIEKIYPLNENEIWLTTDQGIIILNPSKGDSSEISTENKLAGVDRKGRFWTFQEEETHVSLIHIAPNVGSVYYGHSIDLQPSNSPDIFSTYTAAFGTTNETIWVGQCNWIGPGPLPNEGGVRWYDGQTWQGADSSVATGCVTEIEEDSTGQVWVGLNDTLWKYNPTTEHWTSFPPPAPPEGTARFGFFTHLAISPAGDVWAALSMCGGASCMTGDALYRLVEDQWQQVGGIGDFSSAQFFFTSDGVTWLFQWNTLFRVKGNELVIETTYPGQVVLSDDETRIWLTLEQNGQSGLYVIAP